MQDSYTECFFFIHVALGADLTLFIHQIVFFMQPGGWIDLFSYIKLFVFHTRSYGAGSTLFHASTVTVADFVAGGGTGAFLQMHIGGECGR